MLRVAGQQYLQQLAGLRVIGGATPEGESSPMLYTGGLVQLGMVALS